jgi:Flp pilus assembly secretin CpaC
MSITLHRFGRYGWRCFAAAVLLSPVSVWPAAAQSDRIVINLDQAQVLKVPEGVSTLVVGNPLIADVSVQSGGMAVITGKGYGTTNLVALDRSGQVLEQKTIQVQSPRDSVVIYRGVERESYSCAPRCERRITLGDSNDFFVSTLGQTGQRTGQAQGGAQQQK